MIADHSVDAAGEAICEVERGLDQPWTSPASGAITEAALALPTQEVGDLVQLVDDCDLL